MKLKISFSALLFICLLACSMRGAQSSVDETSIDMSGMQDVSLHDTTRSRSITHTQLPATNGAKTSPRKDAQVKAAKQPSARRRSSIIQILEKPATREGLERQGRVYDIDYAAHDAKTGESGLMMAAKQNKYEIVAFLVEQKGAALNEQDKEGNTALHHILKTIIKIKADIEREQKKNVKADKIKIDELNNDLGKARNLALYLIRKMAEFDGGKGLLIKNNQEETPLILVSDDDGSDDDTESGMSGIASALFGKNYYDQVIQGELLKIPIIQQQFFGSDDSDKPDHKRRSEKNGRK